MSVPRPWRRNAWFASGALMTCIGGAACAASDAPSGVAADAAGAGGSAGAGSVAGNDGTPSAGAAGSAVQRGDAATPTNAGGNGGSQRDLDAAQVDEAELTADAAADLPSAEAGGSRPGVFVAVGYGGRTTRSVDDGRTWTNDASLAAKGGDDDNLLRTVVWGNGQFVALGWRVLTSTDGAAWKAQGGVMGQWIGAAVYAKGTYVAVGGYGLRSTSTDGITWKPHTLDEVASHEHGALAFGDVLGGRLVSANDDGHRSFSTNGADWKFCTGAVATGSAYLAFGQGVFVGLGNDQVVISRDGGSTWAAAAKLAVPAAGLVFADGHFTALGDGHVFTSADGSTWQDHASSNAIAAALAYGHGAYVVVRDTTFRRSADGLTWSAPIAAGGSNTYEWITFGTP